MFLRKRKMHQLSLSIVAAVKNQFEISRVFIYCRLNSVRMEKNSMLYSVLISFSSFRRVAMRRVIWCRLWSRTCFPWWWSSSTGPCLPPGPRLPRPKSPPPRRPSTKQTLWETEHFKCAIRDLKQHAWKLFDTSKTDYVFRAVVVSQLVSWSIFISGILLKHEAPPKKCKRRKTPKVHAALHSLWQFLFNSSKCPFHAHLASFESSLNQIAYIFNYWN